MEADRFQRVADLFRKAIRRRPEERSAFLEGACGDDRELRAHVESLLGADAQQLTALDDDRLAAEAERRIRAAAAAGDGDSRALFDTGLPDELPRDEGVGPLTGQRIGRFHLRRLIGSGGMGSVYEAVQSSPRRTVAVKVMKPGVASRAARKRFEYEVQTLARLHHPGIAQVFEAGIYEDGESSMPYFAMEYVRPPRSINAYAASAKLGVREKVELFIEVCDAVHHGHLKGVIHRDLKPSNVLVQTDVGQIIGTIQYMSPEQVDADPGSLDARSDVYSLGVVLHELLTGALPYDLKSLPFHQALGLIKDHPQIRPSLHDPVLRGDLDTILRRAMETDRERRYQSAAELGRDLQRYIRGAPVDARADSAWYVLRKSLMRHRIASAVAVTLFASMAVSSVLLLGLYRQAVIARTRAIEVTDHLADFADLVGQSELTDPSSPIRPSETALEELTRLADTALVGQPIERAKVLTLVGLGQLKLMKIDRSEQHFRTALDLRRESLPSPHKDLAAALHNLGRALFWQSRFDEAVPVYEEAVEMWRALDDGPSSSLARSLNDLGGCLRRLARLEEAERLNREALGMRVELNIEKELAKSFNNLAMCWFDQGRYEEAEREFRNAVSRIEDQCLEPRHVARGWRNVAKCRLHLGDVAQASALGERTLEMSRDASGYESSDAALSLVLLARCRRAEDDLEAATALSREALEIQLKILSASHLRLADTRLLHGELMYRQGSLIEADGHLQSALAARRERLGEDHPDTTYVHGALARVRAAQGLLEEAGNFADSALKGQLPLLGGDHPRVGEAMMVQGFVLLRRGERGPAEARLQESVEVLRRRLPESHWIVREARGYLAECREAAG
jgi:tetratricopeptide (TPR) repeat protein